MNAENILHIAAGWAAEGHQVALATVIETWGSSPRPTGSRMAVTPEGQLAGSVSGGCIEGAVAEAALATLKTGKAETIEFGVTNEMAWEVGLACGGRVKLLVEPLI
jgi:xanthine dehydrogenase accessory factor